MPVGCGVFKGAEAKSCFLIRWVNIICNMANEFRSGLVPRTICFVVSAVFLVSAVTLDDFLLSNTNENTRTFQESK